MAEVSPHSFPASHVLQLVRLLERWDVSAARLLKGTDLTLEGLEEPRARISPTTLIEVSERARTLSGEPGIGFYAGLQRRHANYGHLGFASMHASTLRESLELVVRFGATVTTAISFELTTEGDKAVFTAHEHEHLGSAHDIAVFSLVVGMRTLTEFTTGRSSDRVVTRLPIPRPDYFERFAHLLPNAEFDAPELQIIFSAAALDVPLLTPDRAALRLAQEACERELDELGFDQQWGPKVARLVFWDERHRGLEEIAKHLATSTRTLKRKLASEGLTFSAVVERERQLRAHRYLRSNALSLEDIAERLHYSSLPNFARAFRRWTGETPSQYRARHQQSTR